MTATHPRLLISQNIQSTDGSAMMNLYLSFQQADSATFLSLNMHPKLWQVDQYLSLVLCYDIGA
jgi:hypothetical protein